MRRTIWSPFLNVKVSILSRRDIFFRITSINLTPSRLNNGISVTFEPIKLLPVGIVTSAKNRIFDLSVSKVAMLKRSGRSFGPAKYRYKNVQDTTTIPIGNISKIPNGSNPDARATPSTSRLVDVPKSVSVPPTIAA